MVQRKRTIKFPLCCIPPSKIKYNYLTVLISLMMMLNYTSRPVFKRVSLSFRNYYPSKNNKEKITLSELFQKYENKTLKIMFKRMWCEWERKCLMLNTVVPQALLNIYQTISKCMLFSAFQICEKSIKCIYLLTNSDFLLSTHCKS